VRVHCKGQFLLVRYIVHSQLVLFQATYYIPSVEQQTPKGKLYCRVTNVLARRRYITGTRGVGATTERGKEGPAIQLEFIEEGNNIVSFDIHRFNIYYN